LIVSAWAVPPTAKARAPSPNHFANFMASSLDR
jgi:hypothetical protein